jgi:hypothetical protein
MSNSAIEAFKDFLADLKHPLAGEVIPDTKEFTRFKFQVLALQ